MSETRIAGILLHPTSLPGPGIGDLGGAAYRWVDWLADAGQSLWQVLPLVPVTDGGSPYNGLSAMAGNPLLVSPAGLVADGLLTEEEARDPGLAAGRVDYTAVRAWKDSLIRRAHQRLSAGAAPELRAEFGHFRQRHAHWLSDYTLFRALRDRFGSQSWADWDADIRLRSAAAVERWRRTLQADVDCHAFAQFLFDRQWVALRTYAHRRGVRIVGDIPIFVAYDSADVWAHPELFQLDEQRRPRAVSGVPPDYFSATGQRWGNPLYRWDRMANNGFGWWVERFRRTLQQVDVARIDHFRGFEAYWSIPAEADTAVDGQWVPGPGKAFFHAVRAQLGTLPLIAEDLGLITAEVDALRETVGLPGMRVLQFAFGDDDRNPHLPANHGANSVAYTGTHDNDTSAGWYANAATEAEKRRLHALFPDPAEEVHWAMIRLVWNSVARYALAPLQDVLGLGSEARMNTPGVADGNWMWRFGPEALTAAAARRLRDLTRAVDRLPAATVPPVTSSEANEP